MLQAGFSDKRGMYVAAKVTRPEAYLVVVSAMKALISL